MNLFVILFFLQLYARISIYKNFMVQKSQYLIGYLDEVIRPLVLILPKMNGYVKIFKDKGKDTNQNNKLISFHIDSNKLLEIYETI